MPETDFKVFCKSIRGEPIVPIDPDKLVIRAELEDNNTNAELKLILEDALGDEYTQKINSQRNDIIWAFFRRVNVDPRQVTLEIGERTFDDLEEEHSERHALASALNYYLASQGIRARKATSGLTKDVLSSMITAIRVAEQSAGDSVSDRNPERPNRSSGRSASAASSERNTFPFPTDSSSLPASTLLSLKEWLERTRGAADGPYAVYVLDCTPPPEGERHGQLRRRIKTARELIVSGALDLSERDYHIRDAAAADRVYYVGETNDVVKRINQHLGGPADGGSWFPQLFEPNHLEEVHWYQTKAKAERHERTIGEKIKQCGDSIFAYWD